MNKGIDNKTIRTGGMMSKITEKTSQMTDNVAGMTCKPGMNIVKAECSKLYTLEKAALLREQLKKNDREMVFTNGCFDLIHPGHIRLLREAKAMGHFLLVGLNSDSSVRRLKGENRPIMPQEARALLLCSMEMVDGVIVFNDDTPVPIIERLKPDCFVKGIGWQRDQIPEVSLVTGYGGRVVLLESLSSLSTTEIIKKIRSLPADLL